MNTVLIVEDEKMIRQGIRTMVQRSGVPVQIILECSNGEKAWEILTSQPVDVVFTDIRMPKMNGIELVQKMQTLPHIPLSVAISGYDDFSYAVEMMRSGVRDYLLKPIDREKFMNLMHKLQEELEETGQEQEKQRNLFMQQLRYALLGRLLSGEQVTLEPESREGRIIQGPYRIAAANSLSDHDHDEKILLVKDLEGQDVGIILCQDDLPDMEKYLTDETASAGVSGMHKGFDGLREAFLQARNMQSAAWMENCRVKISDQDSLHIPASLREEALRQLEADASLMRVQLLGTDRTEELREIFRKLFFAAETRRISAEEFLTAMSSFFDEVMRTYRNIIGDSEDEEAQQIQKLREVFSYSSLSDYREAFGNWVFSLQEKIHSANLLTGSEQKMKQAVEFIQAHYGEDLNMAVVSNELSMNYSQFSYSFKQYTGENFVGYLRNVRMEKARELLADTELYIHEIAQKVGYENDKHFMKVFRSACGVSPSEYRRNIRMGENF